ncbi:uncharacterized protein TNCV_2956341 [Trichonephila clavipes]|nr:uncharacterized protein TNCV_2956341 [Trichonephila clavipes]
MGEESNKRGVSWFHINVVTVCTSPTGTPPIEKNAEALLIFSFEQKHVLPLNCGGIAPNRTVTCMVLKATANDRRHLALGHDEFRGPRSGLCRSGGIGNNNKQYR